MKLVRTLYHFIAPFFSIIILVSFVGTLFSSNSFIFDTLYSIFYLKVFYAWLKWVSCRYSFAYWGLYFINGMLIVITSGFLFMLTFKFVDDEMINRYLGIILVSYLIIPSIFWWCVDVFGFVRRRQIKQEQKKREHLQFELEHWDEKIQLMQSSKWRTFLYWYRKPIMIIRSLTGWDTGLKAPFWMVFLVWVWVAVWCILLFSLLNMVSNKSDYVIITEAVHYFIPSLITAMPILLIIMLIFFIVRKALRR